MHLVVQSVVWSVVLQLSQRALQSCEQFWWQRPASPPNLPLDTASALQLFVHSSVQTSCELLVVMESHCLVQESVCVCVQVVTSDSVQLALHWLKVFWAQTCSTEVTEHVVMHS